MSSDDASRLIYWLLKDVNKAVHDFDMIQDGDRVAVAVSGGKDSLSLLELLSHRIRTSKEKYSLVAIHVIGDANGPDNLVHEPLENWFLNHEYEYVFEPMVIPEGESLPMDCNRCTWNRRRTLFETARHLGCNKVAMGHHADDLAQTTLMNLIFSGRVETMSPNAEYFGGIFHLIRPLCYLHERRIRSFSKVMDFPTPPSSCPRNSDSRRQNTKELIQQAEGWCKDIRVNLLRAGLQGIQSLEATDEKSG
jgi:tRNA(Ile)-lysidine synthase TilS/MesJ